MRAATSTTTGMRIRVNGEAVQLEGEITLTELLERLGHGDKAVALAINMTFIPSSSRATTRVRDGDEVEIVEPRQGG